MAVGGLAINYRGLNMEDISVQSRQANHKFSTPVKHHFPESDRKTQRLRNRELTRQRNELEKRVWQNLSEHKFIGKIVDKGSDASVMSSAQGLSQDVSPNRIVLFVSSATSLRKNARQTRKASTAVVYKTGTQSDEWARRLYKVNYCGELSDLHMNAELLGIAEALAIALVWVVQDRSHDSPGTQPEVVVFTSCTRVLPYIDRLRDETVAKKAARPARDFAVYKLISRSQWLHRLGVGVQLRCMPSHLSHRSVDGMVHAQAVARFALDRAVIPLDQDEGLKFMINGSN